MEASTDAAKVLAAVEQALPAFLPQQRWYAAKNAEIRRVEVIDIAPLGNRDSALLIGVHDADAGRAERYFVPFALRNAGDTANLPPEAMLSGTFDALGGRIVEGSRDEHVTRALMEWIAAAQTVPAQNGGQFVAEKTPAFESLQTAARGDVHRMSVEQSNTSIVVGGEIMLKLYRHVHPGPQPELEFARFFSAARFEATPALLGAIEYRRDGERTACAIAQRFARNDGDAWTVALERLVAALRDGDPKSYQRAVALAERIGARTADMHRALATPLGDEAFEPETVTATDVERWTARAVESADAAFGALEKRLPGLETLPRARARALLERRGELDGRLRASHVPGDAKKTRVHGDFHLGQVLVTGDDVLLVDFEGEPARSLEERRAKASPLRDVAGMLRSFDYVASAAERALVDGASPAQPSATIDVAERARAWREQASRAFLSAYGKGVLSAAPPSRELLDLFVVEKACYELSYELANRPLWVDIPLGGLERILDEPATAGGSR